VWHHAPSDMPGLEPFGDLLHEAGFALVLHGDAHETRAAWHSPFRRPLVVAGAGAFWIEIAQDFSYFRIYAQEQKKAGGPFEQNFDFWDEEGRARVF